MAAQCSKLAPRPPSVGQVRDFEADFEGRDFEGDFERQPSN